MPHRSPFDYDVSVSADKRRRTRRRGMSGAFATAERRCDWEGCDCKGEYRAPRSPDHLDEYFWFCVDHVRAYNRSWNYFERYSDAELDAQMRADMVWDRPTWSFGQMPRGPAGMHPHAEGQAWKRFGFEDPMEVLGENATLNPGPAEPKRPSARRRLPPTERRALHILGAPDTATRTELRGRYRALVKNLHPDMNGGRRDDEARLREVLWAWDRVKESRLFKD